MNGKTNTALSSKHCTPPQNESDHEGIYNYLCWLMAKHGINSDSLHYLELLYTRDHSSTVEDMFSAAVHLTDNADPISELHQEDPDEFMVNKEDFQELLQTIQEYRKTRSNPREM